MKRHRPTLSERAAAIFEQQHPRRRLPNFVEQTSLTEIERALERRQRDVLVALDRVRDAAALPQDPRVARELKIERLKTTILSSWKKGAAA